MINYVDIGIKHVWGISEEPTLSLASRIYFSKKQAEQRYGKSLTDGKTTHNDFLISRTHFYQNAS